MAGKPLTIQLIQQKTKTDSLSSIKNLNLWGNDLDDLKVLRQLPNLEVLSLSVNNITTLKEVATCLKLKELYLRKNNISEITELRNVQNLLHLKVLWLQDNPCADIQNYRLTVIRYLPHLDKLDNQPVTEQERTSSKQIQIGDCVDNSQQNFDDAQNEEKNYFFKSPSEVKRPSTGYQAKPEQQYNQQQLYQQQQAELQQQQMLLQYQQQQQQVYQQQQYLQEAEEPKYDDPTITTSYDRNENILCAVLALVKELDENSLEVVKRDVERKIQLLKNSKSRA